jgi:hypothetical protein
MYCSSCSITSSMALRWPLPEPRPPRPFFLWEPPPAFLEAMWGMVNSGSSSGTLMVPISGE